MDRLVLFMLRPAVKRNQVHIQFNVILVFYSLMLCILFYISVGSGSY